MRNKKGFMLIELIAVLVIMAIIALIVTPLVMNIIKKARIAADRRSIDAYGRSIEYAIAGYLLDTGTFPTSIGDLTIEYSGDEVVCATTELNDDSSIYLSGCTVAGRNVDYVYETDRKPRYNAYSVGDTITYNGVSYYVLNDSGAKTSSVTLLKAEPISYEDVEAYNTYENVYAYDISGYGAFPYSGETQNYGSYELSYVKGIVDAWASDNVGSGLVEARLLTSDELISGYGYEYIESGTSHYYQKTANTPSWLYNASYDYWTMSAQDDGAKRMWVIKQSGNLDYAYSDNTFDVVIRPVITLSKSVL